MAFEAVVLVIAALALVIGAISFFAFKVQKEEYERTGKHPKGHYMGVGLAIGLAMGLPLGLAMGTFAIGPGIGVAIGIAIGAAMEKQHESELRPPTPKEKDMRNKLMLFLLFSTLLGIIAFAYLWMLA